VTQGDSEGRAGEMNFDDESGHCRPSAARLMDMWTPWTPSGEWYSGSPGRRGRTSGLIHSADPTDARDHLASSITRGVADSWRILPLATALKEPQHS
jgi:hypothetical protein